MGVLKKIFRKREKEDKKENECWYNNYHEQKKESWVEPIEGACCSPNSVYYTVSQQAAKHQG